MAIVKQKDRATKGGNVKHEITETLRNAKKYLRRGDLKAIANELKLTDQTVSDVMAGKFKNWDVIEKVLERAQKNKAILQNA